ncbi:hypothetical protein GDO78_016214 [Eleutherodactylus coqui]|uniref:Uncharacterized protein n=1 Tax=Eleutherodactylus coqui TaxID=57060 RepID=A0A8J6EBI8_ELECQ|nr:hypothetical protein GDO78_016214 [Eleutherodactylus coqui]
MRSSLSRITVDAQVKSETASDRECAHSSSVIRKDRTRGVSQQNTVKTKQIQLSICNLNLQRKHTTKGRNVGFLLYYLSIKKNPKKTENGFFPDVIFKKM